LKRWRQNERHRAANKPYRTGARTAARKAAAMIDAGPSDEATALIREASSILDRAAKRRVIHPNAAARQKSRLMRRLHRVGGGDGAAEAPKRGRKTAAKKTRSAAATKKTRGAAAAKKTTTRARKTT
jgi:small subunit ribosomal protein S20